ITGSSTGIGRETALHFLAQGWNVAATMRTPERSDLPQDPKLFSPRLDVTIPAAIEEAFRQTQAKFGPIDVVINNAGYGLTGPFEGAEEDEIKRRFDTNVFGLMRVSKTAIRHWREAGQKGTLVNVTSMGGRLTVPYYSVYHSTKWAVEGFTESLQYEVESLGIRVKLVEPGAIRTDFYERSAQLTDTNAPHKYQDLLRVARLNMNEAGRRGTHPTKVAAAIYTAATSTGGQLRFTVGQDAKMLLGLRRMLPESAFYGLVRSQIFKKA
ncbi:MAG: SDR family oxidoreductase, partial [Pseudobdellovibrionaceae bacterium]|nr:SDR family oxidoreductase [Pseudobdellovibrionaceae bacterium]